MNHKQDSKEGIAKCGESGVSFQKEITDISEISDAFLKATSMVDFNKLIVEHEQIISSIININPVKENLFSDYFGEVKSLGAWGGDFVMVTGNDETPAYFKKKGFETLLQYSEMIL